MVKKGISKNKIKIVKDYIERITKEDKVPVNKVIVFGSQAKGDFRKDSDIDVCIVSPRFGNRLEAMRFLWSKRIRKEILNGLEPIGFSPKDFKEGSSLIDEIKKTGVLVR